MHDFVVVGAGPAGSRFARSASERGHDVLVFEQGTIGEPLACSGHVSLDVWEYVPDGAREELFQNEIRGARFHLGGPDSRAYPFYRDGPISNAVDRVGLDRALARAASDAGADVRDSHTVTAVDEGREAVTVTARGPDGTESHEARMVVGADGPRSRVREQCSIPEPDEFLHGVLGFDPEPDHEAFVDVHLTVPGFFAWRIPRGEDGVEYGLAVSPGDDLNARFDRLTAGYDATIDRRCSGLIPVGPASRTIGRRSLLVGDAAGQTKPFTGGGILYGMRSADHAARTVDPTDPATLSEYESAWREELGTEIRLGHAVRAGYSVPAPLQRLGLRAFSGEIGVHMDEPSSLFSREQLRAMF
ncbi:geranylgeranyl reductase family protein [Halosegnis rubeus]|jgi:geranylgeranyl reductase family protein|uniref:Geranylgeranyl reductase family protein n=1 Tax=Halosegnis rubeus TaxID=2212850 RepID=A0A5N5UBP3_9EURY|nr:geranylgeranyl reductase family protein [Halosegnis rubeus]KAB7516018.1 geranylgeranyl reductase family protein [Halosegnis rubeus]KAB7516773.1 geranylgeranyl reductase family protein [Halosegnis rubeus]KAB7520101.1 geranylgeranyl reductase family protein [Halosegnis rubeus]